MEILRNLAEYIEHKTSYVPDFKLWLYGDSHDDKNGNPCDEFELYIKNKDTLQLKVLSNYLSLTITKENIGMLSGVIKERLGSPYAVTLVDTGDFSVDVIQTTVLQIKLDWLSDNFYQTDTVNDVAVKICSLLNDSKTTVRTIDKINKQIFSFMYGMPYPQSVTV